MRMTTFLWPHHSDIICGLEQHVLTKARQEHLDYTASLMLILASFMRLKALDNSQTDHGSVERYTSTALELRDVCGRCPTAVQPFDLSLCIHWTAGSLFTDETLHFRLYTKGFRGKRMQT